MNAVTVSGTVVGLPKAGATRSMSPAASVLLRVSNPKSMVMRVNGYDEVAAVLGNLCDGDRVLVVGELVSRASHSTGNNVMELKARSVGKL